MRNLHRRSHALISNPDGNYARGIWNFEHASIISRDNTRVHIEACWSCVQVIEKMTQFYGCTSEIEKLKLLILIGLLFVFMARKHWLGSPGWN